MLLIQRCTWAIHRYELVLCFSWLYNIGFSEGWLDRQLPPGGSFNWIWIGYEYLHSPYRPPFPSTKIPIINFFSWTYISLPLTSKVTEAWLKTGLKPRCITRDLKWGTQVWGVWVILSIRIRIREPDPRSHSIWAPLIHPYHFAVKFI